MAQRTRNKIALAPLAALRLFADTTRQPFQPRTWTRVSKNLDEIDLKILGEIQADGRITNVELAKRVGISPPPCLRRVRTLEEAGYIQGYRGLLDPRRLGFDVTVFASVHLSSQADADLRAVEEFVRAEPLVRASWMWRGGAAGAGVLDVVGRGRLHSEMRGARHGDFSELRHASDGGAARAQRQDI